MKATANNAHGSSPSKRQWQKFQKVFWRGLEMWTSEDGGLLSIAIIVRSDWREVLQKEYAHIFDSEAFDENQGKLCHVEQRWVGKEYFDGPGSCNQKRGKLWFITEEKTPFPIINYELKIPR